MKALAIVVTRRVEDAQRTLDSLFAQTLQPDIYIADKPGVWWKSVGQRVGEAINEVLDHIDLTQYDWLLKADDDILFPPDFLEENIAADYDIMGMGAGLLIRMQPFLAMLGRWNETDMEDSLPHYVFEMRGLKCLLSDWVCKPTILKWPQENIKRRWEEGHDCYRVGWPLDTYIQDRAVEGNLTKILGYLYAWARKLPLNPFADEWREYLWIRRGLTWPRGLYYLLTNPVIRKRILHRMRYGVPRWARHPTTIQLDTHNYCNLNCIYCLGKDTLVLMGDLSWKPIQHIEIGDQVIGLHKPEEGHWKYVKTTVRKTFKRKSRVIRFITEKSSVICTPNHRWLDKHSRYRPAIKYNTSTNQRIKWLSPPTIFEANNAYKSGWLRGIIEGDGCLKKYPRNRGYNPQTDVNYYFRLAVKDYEIIDRFLKYTGLTVKPRPHKNKTGDDLIAIPCNNRTIYNNMINIVKYWIHDKDFYRGYLAGIFDAEGSYSDVIRITNYDEAILKRITESLTALNFDWIQERHGIRLRGGLEATVYFFAMTNPAVQRRRQSFFGKGCYGTSSFIRIEKIEEEQTVYNLETDTHNYIANGLVSKNCNPQHAFAERRGRGYMPIDVMETVLRYFSDRGLDVDTICAFMNGEILLEHRLPDITPLFDKYQPHATVEAYSNGTLYKNRDLLMNPHIDVIRFTISAASRETYRMMHGHDKFHDALNTLEWVTDHLLPNQRIILNYVLTGLNFHELPQWRKRFAQYTHDIRPLHFSLDRATSAGLDAEQPLTWDDLIRQMWSTQYAAGKLSEGRPCPNWHNLSITWEGDVLQCPDVSPVDGVIGRYDEDLLDLWQRKFQRAGRHPCCATCSQRMPYYDECFRRLHAFANDGKPTLYGRLVGLRQGY